MIKRQKNRGDHALNKSSIVANLFRYDSPFLEFDYFNKDIGFLLRHIQTFGLYNDNVMSIWCIFIKEILE